MKVSENDIVNIITPYLEEWGKLNEILTGQNTTTPEIDKDEIKYLVDKCVYELKRLNKLKPIKLK